MELQDYLKSPQTKIQLKQLIYGKNYKMETGKRKAT